MPGQSRCHTPRRQQGDPRWPLRSRQHRPVPASVIPPRMCSPHGVFNRGGQGTFRTVLGTDDGTWTRARGYALHQAALTIPPTAHAVTAWHPRASVAADVRRRRTLRKLQPACPARSFRRSRMQRLALPRGSPAALQWVHARHGPAALSGRGHGFQAAPAGAAGRTGPVWRFVSDATTAPVQQAGTGGR